MSGNSMHLRLMLQQYETQLLAARRLARYRRAQRLAEGNHEPPIDPQVRRKALVERVAHELYETIVFTGSDNPVVDKIRTRLGSTLGGAVHFNYPPGAERLQIVRENADGAKAVPASEQAQALRDLWNITLHAVDESML